MSKGRIVFIFVFCLVFLGLDAALKVYTYKSITPMQWSSYVYPYGGIPVFKDFFGIDFSLNYVTNKGAAWGVLSTFQDYLLYLRFLIMGGILSYIIFVKLPFFKKFALSLVLTGAAGNVVDYFLYHHVVDMFFFCFWGYAFPVFNIADSMIFCGVVVLLLHGLLESGKKHSHKVF